MILVFSVWDPNTRSKIDSAKSLKKVDSIVILGMFEINLNMLNTSFENVVDLSLQFDCPLHIITGLHSDYVLLTDIENPRYKNIKLYHWPTFFLSLTYQRLNSPYTNHNESLGLGVRDLYCGLDPETFDFTYISMTKARKKHRCIMMDLLAKNDLIEKGAVTWRSEPRCREEFCQDIVYDFQYWKEEPLFLDQTTDDKLFNQEIVPKEYITSFIQIVPETDDEVFFLTEKTAIALFFNKPFLVISIARFHEYLKKLGFKLYDELFDYAFDNVDDIYTRYQMICDNITRIDNMSTQEKRQKLALIKDKLIYNKQRGIELATDIQNFPEIWNKLAENDDIDVSINPKTFNDSINDTKL